MSAEHSVRRHFMCDHVGWTARRNSHSSGIQFLSAFGEERLLPIDRSALPTDVQMASASEAQLQDWLRRSRPQLDQNGRR
jgi:hypothetical protein